MRKKLTLFFLLIAAGLMFLSSCSTKTDLKPNPTPKATPSKEMKVTDGYGNGKIHFRIRGHYSEDFDSAGASLDLIELKTVGQPGSEGKYITIWTTFENFDDLLNMSTGTPGVTTSTGIMGDLGILVIPSGTYNQARCHVYDGWAMKNGKKYPVIFPGDKMDLDFQPPVIVGEHLSADIVLDIDVVHQFIPIGNPKNPTGFIFRPQVLAINNTTSGTIAGSILDANTGNPLPNAKVWVVVNGQPVVTYTFNAPTPDGFNAGDFVIPDIPQGTYTIYASQSGYTTGNTSVYVLEGNYNSTYIALTPGL